MARLPFYTYAVSRLKAGGSYGNVDTFARTSRESDLQGLWNALDDQYYCGNLTATPWVEGRRLSGATTVFHAVRQTTWYHDGELTIGKTFFLPVGQQQVSRAAYLVFALGNVGSTARDMDLVVDLRWNATPVAEHLKVPPPSQGEKVIESTRDGTRILASTISQRYTRDPNFCCPAGQNPMGNVKEARVFGAPIEPLSCELLPPSRLRLRYRIRVEAGARVEFPLIIAFSPNGPAAALADFQRARDHVQVLALSEEVMQERLLRSTVFTPNAIINRGVQWGKVNTFRVMHRYASGLGFTNDPPQDILVVRDAAWYAMGASYLDRDFVADMWRLIADHATHAGGKLAEFVRCSASPTIKDDDGLNINDDTPLWLHATHHHYAVTRDAGWLAATYGRVRETAEYILAQIQDGLVNSTTEGTNVYGIASWRNIIPGYRLNGHVTEINAECVGALRAAAELALVMEDSDNAQAWAKAADALAAAVNTRLVSPRTGLYALSRDPGGALRHDVTGDQVFPLLFGVATPELSRRVLDHLTRRAFWSERGLRTVGQGEPEYDPSYGWGLLGGSWPNLTAWACHAFRKLRPELVAQGMQQIYAASEMEAPLEGGRTVPGEFPEWFDGDTMESRGMAMSPWMPPTYVWLALESLAGLVPQIRGPDRVEIDPHLPPEWTWLGGRNISLGKDQLAFFLHEGTLHVAGCQVKSPLPVESYDADVTDRVPSDAPFTLALQNGTQTVVFVATDGPCRVRLELAGETEELDLAAGEVRVFRTGTFPGRDV